MKRLLLCCALFSSSIQAATYYVSPSGSDAAAGTITAPFATLQHGHDVALPGDTIYLRGGTYTLTGQIAFTRSGSSGLPIKVWNYPGETPILDGSAITNPDATNIRMVDASWWYFKGIEVANSPNIGLVMWNASNNNIVEACNVHHSGRLATIGSGIIVTNTSANNLILNNDSHHNKDQGGGGNSDGIDVTSSGTGNVVRGNRVWRNSDDGIDLWNAVPVLVENNWAWENGYDDNFTPLGDGNGFKLGGAGSGDGGHTIRNNLSWRNRTRGYDDNAADIAMSVYNNTAYENGSPNFAFTTAGVAHVLKNNLSFGPSGVSLNASVQQSFNSWNLAVTVDAGDFSSLDFTGATGPRQPDGSLPVLSFLHLVSGSDLIDKGTDVGIAYSGSAPDLGAYEATGSPPPPTYTLTVAVSGPGSVSGPGIACGSDCTEPYAAGTIVTLTATPANKKRFVGWGGACTGTATMCSLTINAAASVTATFANH